MPTVQEILKATGLTDEQISSLDQKAVTAFDQVLVTANTESAKATRDREAAELASRAQSQQYDEVIAPALNSWGNKEANLTAERDYYKSLSEKAKTGGFITEAPPFDSSKIGRDEQGKFVTGQNPVPGSPGFVDSNKLRSELATGITALFDLNTKHMRLYGSPIPDDSTTLIREAQAQRLDPVVYAGQKYKFAEKEQELAQKKQKEHDDAIETRVAAAKDKEWSERLGNNPDVRQGTTSKFSKLNEAVKHGDRPDPLTMTPNERAKATRAAIHREVSERVQ